MEEITSGEALWEWLLQNEGQSFYTKKGLEFTYYIKGGELFASRRERSITRSTFEYALRRLRERPQEVTGPKSLNVYGAPYVYALLCAALEAEEDNPSDLSSMSSPHRGAKITEKSPVKTDEKKPLTSYMYLCYSKQANEVKRFFFDFKNGVERQKRGGRLCA
ncbi:MAG: hypothetical protein LUE31_06260 [Lachnospiraceae bacterium]|nr:hypothetical protein [Lachnospiraceae bacterium]